jgi:hypothetical protein
MCHRFRHAIPIDESAFHDGDRFAANGQVMGFVFRKNIGGLFCEQWNALGIATRAPVNSPVHAPRGQAGTAL